MKELHEIMNTERKTPEEIISDKAIKYSLRQPFEPHKWVIEGMREYADQEAEIARQEERERHANIVGFVKDFLGANLFISADLFIGAEKRAEEALKSAGYMEGKEGQK